MLPNGFSTTFRIVGQSLGLMTKDSKSPDFEQKAWAIAHGFEHGGFGKCRESFQTPRNAGYVLENGFSTTFGILAENLG